MINLIVQLIIVGVVAGVSNVLIKILIKKLKDRKNPKTNFYKDPKKLLTQMTKVYLDVNKFNTIYKDAPITSELEEAYEPILVKVQPGLKMPMEYAHIGYEAFSEFYDLNGVDVWKSKRIKKDLTVYRNEPSLHKFLRKLRGN